MKKLRRFTLTAILILSLALTISLLYSKYSVADNGTYQYVILDYADLLTDAEEKELTAHMQQLTPYGNIIFQTVILDTTAFEKYSEDTYYNYFGNEPGVIFQIDMGNRKLTISSSTALDDQISYERDTIVDNVYRYASNGDYLSCASECFDEIYAVLNDEAIAHTMKYIDNAIIAVILSLILNYLIVFASGKKKVSAGEILGTVAVASVITSAAITKGELKKIYSPSSSGSGGGGGGFSGGGGGGGGFSGGSSSHGF